VPAMAKQTISGTNPHGKPVEVGWVGLWRLRGRENVVNANMLRGRTVFGNPAIHASAPLKDGKYSLEVPYQDNAWYVVVEAPGQALHTGRPIKIAANEKKSLDIACTEGGSIRGRVKNAPAAGKVTSGSLPLPRRHSNGNSRKSDDTFSFSQLPPDTYGLKVGYDGYQDSEVPRWPYASDEVWEKKSDPWQRAKVVAVEAGHETSGVE